MRITDLSCGTAIWRAAIQRRPTFGRSTSSRTNCSRRCGRPDSKCAPEISARTSRRSGPTSRAFLWARYSVRRLGDARTHRSPHALRPHRSLPVRIEESPARRPGRSALSALRHGDRNGRRRSLAGRPDQGSPSCASPSGPSAALSWRILATGSHNAEIVNDRSQAVR
jgi:hypothetical protein